VSTTTNPVDELVLEFVDAALEGEPERARRLGLDQADRTGPVATIEDLLTPALRRAGELWLTTQLPSHGEHRVTGAVDAVLEGLMSRLPLATTGPRVAVSTGDDDWHGTAARLAGVLLRARGWRARFVGPAMTASRLDDLLRLDPVDVVALSCASPSHLAGVGRTALAVHARGLPVVVGGGVFDLHPVRAVRVGADAGPGTLPGSGEQLQSWLDDVLAGGLAVPPMAAHAAFELDAAQLLQAVLDTLDQQGPLVARQLREDLVRTTVDTWISAVAVDDVGLVREQLGWVRTYLLARSLPGTLVAQLAGALRSHVPIDLGGHLERTARG